MREHVKRVVAPAAALGAAAFLLAPSGALSGFSKSGELLSLEQRDFRVFNNFLNPEANDNVTPDDQFPGALGAPLALWKAYVEWGSGPHGLGTGDPTQANLGDGGANFDPAWGGAATGPGGTNDNVVSGLACGLGVVGFLETPSADGWRMRFCQGVTWDDGPGAVGLAFDIQGVATHEFGHALGLGHSGIAAATMAPSTTQIAARSIELDDISGIQCIYGAKSAGKPTVTDVAAAAGTVTITGENFDATQNTVWFTSAEPTSPEEHPIVTVSGVASSLGGTEIVLAIPAGAGPGDLLVQIPGAGGDALSNAFPTDLGSPPLPVASAVFRNGTGVNPACLSSLSPPVLGSTWMAGVDASGHPGATFTHIQCRLGSQGGVFIGAGELLIDLSTSRCFARTQVASGGLDVFQVPVPASVFLLGATSSIQGLVLGGAGPRLCNALDVTLGV